MEFLHNEYRRTFIEMHTRICDMLSKDAYIGGMLVNAGIDKCPVPVVSIYQCVLKKLVSPQKWSHRCKGRLFTLKQIWLNLQLRQEYNQVRFLNSLGVLCKLSLQLTSKPLFWVWISEMTEFLVWIEPYHSSMINVW